MPQSETEQILFLVECLQNLLELSFTASKWDVLNEDTIQITTHYLPAVPVVEKHRLKILAVLKDYFRHYTNDTLRLASLKVILDVPREIARNRRDRNSYKSDKEVAFILQFLETEAEGFSLACQKEIKDALYWYKKQRVDKKFHSKIDEIIVRLEPKNLAQKLVAVFSELENVVDDRGNKRKTFINALLQQYSATDVAQALSALYQVPDKAFLFSQTIQEFTQIHPAKAFDAYFFLKSNDRRFILGYGSHFLRSMRQHEDYENAYWNEVDFWLSENSAEASNLLLHTYSIYSVRQSKLKIPDSELIEALATRHRSETEYNAAHALPVVYLVKGDGCESIFSQFLNECKQSNAEHLFRLLFSEFGENPFLHELFLKYSIRFSLSHYIEHSLLKVAEHLAVAEIFDYFLKRLLYKLSLSSDRQFYYDFVPVGDYPYFVQHLSSEKRYALFELALSWFVRFDGDWIKRHCAENLIEYLMPSHDIDEALTAIYRRTYMDCKSNTNEVLRLSNSLATFHNKSHELFSLLSYIGNDMTLLHGSKLDFLHQLKSSFRNVITSAGVKSGTPGQPFPFDLRLRNLLQEAIVEYNENHWMKSILTLALKDTEATIACDTERHRGEEW